ncbi:PAS domain-containing sensor histidine kinase [Eisenibacter elegans]|uniref:PAS domain-containing sensor histidine kinase n=1 Tax=Eisenibacter elegans TaxID=997 RepID=UPI000429B2F2|nr:ATP-binding protein [Eisenibacter elegans]
MFLAASEKLLHLNLSFEQILVISGLLLGMLALWVYLRQARGMRLVWQQMQQQYDQHNEVLVAQQQRLQESAVQLKAILNNLSHAYCLLSPQKNILTFNTLAYEYAQELFGQRLREGAPVAPMIPEEVQPVFEQLFQKALLGERHILDQSLKIKYAGRVWYQFQVNPVYDMYGQIYAVSVGMVDITTRKRAEERVRRQNKELAQKNIQLEHSQQTLQKAKQRVEQIYALTANISGDLKAQIREVLEASTEAIGFEQGVIYQLQSEHLILFEHVSRVTIAADWLANTNMLEGIPLAQSIEAACCRDHLPLAIDHVSLTEYAHTLNHLEGGVEAYLGIPLIVQDRLFGVLSFFNSEPLPQRIVQTDVDFIIILGQWVSAALTRHTNEQTLRQQKAVIEQQKEQLERQLRVLDKNHQTLKTAQAQLIETEKLATIGQLSAGIAHDINTPLGAIQASVENMRDSVQQTIRKLPLLLKALDEKYQKLFFALVAQALQQGRPRTSAEERQQRRQLKALLESYQLESADSLADTLTDIGLVEDWEQYIALLLHPSRWLVVEMAYHLTTLQRDSAHIQHATEKAAVIVHSLKRFTHPADDAEAVPVDLADSLETVLVLFANYTKKGLDIVRRFDAVPHIWGYPDELTQVWSNLIHNALQAMNYQGTIKIQLQMHSLQEVVVAIRDSGQGIAPELIPKIFEPFFTTKKIGEGSGLGLHTVKKIVEKHQGRIDVQSEQGFGTVFMIYLPIHQPATQTTEST